MEIRKANINDVESLEAIEKECFLAPYTKEGLISEFKDNEFANIYVCIKDEKIVGFIDFWITFDSSTIAQIATLKAYRRLGIGRMLMKTMLAVLKENDVFVSTLEVRAKNETAIKFYESFGYMKNHIIEKYYTNGDDAIYMMRGV